MGGIFSRKNTFNLLICNSINFHLSHKWEIVACSREQVDIKLGTACAYQVYFNPFVNYLN